MKKILYFCLSCNDLNSLSPYIQQMYVSNPSVKAVYCKGCSHANAIPDEWRTTDDEKVNA